MPAPGPAALGRGVVIDAARSAPAAWSAHPVVVLDGPALREPAEAVTTLHREWSARRPVVVALAVDPSAFRAPQSWVVAPHTLTPGFEAWLDRLQFLVWANNYDARAEGEPVWWWAAKAGRLGANPASDGPCDIVLPDGTAAWVDGGPRTPIEPADVEGLAVVHRETVEQGALSTAPPPAAPTAELAPDQLAAVGHRSGPARVIAPAGSGKTRVLTERVRHLLVDRGLETGAVLAVAYNKQAQLELEARLADIRPRVRTINSLGYGLLTEARGRAPAVLDEREVRRRLEPLLPARPRRANTDPLGPYLEALTEIRLGLRDPGLVEAERDDVAGLAEAFEPFRRSLAADGVIDFDEQIYGAIEHLLHDGAFRRRMQHGSRHLLVDELQDLTPAHVLMLRLLAAPGLDVFGVGDDDQVIYGHVGADPGFLIDFERYFPGGGAHALEVNYRCPATVVDAARHLVSYNHRRVAKSIHAGPGADSSPDALRIARHPPDDGAGDLTAAVQGWLADDVAPGDIAVLARVNSLLLAPHVALAEAGVPLSSSLRPDVLERTGVRAALAYLRIGADPGRVAGSDVLEVHRRPSRGLPQWFAKWVHGTTSVPDLRKVADKIDDERVSAKVHDLVDDLERIAAAVADGTTRTTLEAIRDDIGRGQAMGLLDGGRGGEGSTHLDDLEALTQVAGLHPDPATFEPWLRAVFHREAEPGGVTLSTIHRVKGREWPCVAVFGVTAGLMPHRLVADVEEERRVLHVAVTRGRHRVVVLADESRPSPFLDELVGTAPHRRPEEAVPQRPADRAAAPRPRRQAAGASDDKPREGAGAEAERRLKAWRLQRSRADNVPAYVVLSNRHLRALAQARPTTLVALAKVEGIGPTRLDLYGDDILAVLDQLT
ncbi:hypothetical protein BH20ACT2_BH20ACT2_00050 [soil metagenome]